MSVPAVKGYMPLCVTPRSQICDEQGVGRWPMWKRFDKIKAIVDEYVETQYRGFFALPLHEVDKLKAEEMFYWFTPKSKCRYVRLSQMGDDHDHYKQLLDATLSHYRSVVELLKGKGLSEEANFLQLSLKYAGDSEDCIYCGDERVVAVVWGMRPRQGYDLKTSILESDLTPPTQIHTVSYDIGTSGTTDSPTLIKKRHGTRIYGHQIPNVTPLDGYDFVGWDKEPLDTVVDDDLVFTAQYKKNASNGTGTKPEGEGKESGGGKKVDPPIVHKVRFLTPEGLIIKELQVRHGEKLQPGLVPQLPTIGDVICSAWDGDPFNDVVMEDRDYRAIAPEKPKQPLHNVRFLTSDGDVISQFQVGHGTRLEQSQIPPLPVFDGETCPVWDKNPLADDIVSDVDFTARKPKKKSSGWIAALLRWLLLALGLLLLFLFLRCLLFGNCFYNPCGCDCNCDNNTNKKRVTPVQKPCNTKQLSGGIEGYLNSFDLGRDGGKFKFEYNTYSVPDRVTVYEGKGTSGKVLYDFEGSCDDEKYEILFSSNRYVTVEVTGSEDGTAWVFNVGCPFDE